MVFSMYNGVVIITVPVWEQSLDIVCLFSSSLLFFGHFLGAYHTALHETKRFILGNFSFTIMKRFVSYYEMKRLLSVNETFLFYKRFIL